MTHDPSLVRKAAVAGSFYPRDPAKLRRQIDGLLASATPDPTGGRPLILVSPHAGYVYSGPVAAHGYKLLSGLRFRTVVILSPSHVEYFPFVSAFDGEAYETPLGCVLVDHELSTELAEASPLVRRSPRGHVQEDHPHQEHALEVQIPFLQSVLKNDFRVVPLIMGHQDWETCEALGHALAPLLKRRDVLIVVSSDLSHFYSHDVARKKDDVFCKLLEEMDAPRLYESVRKGECEACGAGPVVASVIASKTAGRGLCRVLNRATSGDVTGDRSRVVGYASAVIFDVGDEIGELLEKAGLFESPLPDEVKAYLLRSARGSIERFLDVAGPPPEAPSARELDETRGVFVTLRKGDRLRGCVGSIEPRTPLRELVPDMARAAAFHDPRFGPVRAEELPDLVIEISILAPPSRVTDPASIDVGRHGLIVESGGHRGLLLPEVASERGWDTVTFLEQTCAKASLPADAWRFPETRIYAFTTLHFGDQTHLSSH